MIKETRLADVTLHENEGKMILGGEKSLPSG